MPTHVSPQTPVCKNLKRIDHDCDERENSEKKRRRSSIAVGFRVLQDEAGPSKLVEKQKSQQHEDRFITVTTDEPISMASTPRSVRLAQRLGEAQDKRLHVQTPKVTNPNMDHVGILTMRKSLTKDLYETPCGPSEKSALVSLRQRPQMTLDAPGLRDDFYSHPISWSKSDTIALTTRFSVSYRNMQTRKVGYACHFCSVYPSTCVEWSPSQEIFAYGRANGLVLLFDAEKEKCRMHLYGCDEETDSVSAIAWQSPFIMYVGYDDGTITRYDVRAQEQSCVRANERVCGLKWNATGTILASGHTNNSVMCWDPRMNNRPSIEVWQDDDEDLPRIWRTRKHKSTVKALAWAPWQSSLLATGGGTKDGSILFWDGSTGERKELVIETKSQISSLHFSPSCREIVSTHGYAFDSDSPIGTPIPRKHSILVHNYPKGEQVGKILDARHGRISDSCLGPDGTILATTGADETIQLYRIFGKQSPIQSTSGIWKKSLIR